MKKYFIFSLFLVLCLFLVSAETNYCCEKTASGAWCQNDLETNCDASYRVAPTSCESTSYCKRGCCYDSQEGTCTENSPQKVCEDGGGVWEDDALCVIPQCSLGCCVLGDQAAFVTQVRCKRLASLYGLETTFNSDITSEVQCIMETTSETEGACVYGSDYDLSCIFTTQSECDNMEDSNSTFYKDYLCSSDELGTNCGPTEDTVCVEGKDQVYFVDSCGNVANVYDASKIDDKEYWSKIYRLDESCGYGDSNANSKECGNCDYYLGSTCKEYERGEDKTSPSYGDNICRDLSCTWDGATYNHGETWCADAEGTGENLPGSRYFRLVCYNGEVTVEPCADYRQEVCEENDVEGFSSAACVANQWEDCVLQEDQDDCENSDLRDCRWATAGSISLCVPNNAPGFDFWTESSNDSSEEGSKWEATCALADTSCVVTYETDLFGGKECVDNCECLEDSWEDEMEAMCRSIGDCGGGTNYIGREGSNSEDDE